MRPPPTTTIRFELDAAATAAPACFSAATSAFSAAISACATQPGVSSSVEKYGMASAEQLQLPCLCSCYRSAREQPVLWVL